MENLLFPFNPFYQELRMLECFFSETQVDNLSKEEQDSLDGAFNRLNELRLRFGWFN